MVTIARERGKNPEAMQELFLAQIELAKQVQRFVLNDPERIPKWARGLDLASDLRPVLIDLGDQIVVLLAQHLPSPVTSEAVLGMAAEEVATEGVGDEGKRHLGEVVWLIMTK